MQRESDKHGMRLDDELAHEVESMVRGMSGEESRAREDRVKEEPTEDDARTLLDQRADLARHLAAADWPADRQELLAAAEADHAPDEILDRLRQLPEGVRFETFQAVWAALGGPVEGHHTHG
jgi:hypothetical protein